MLYFITGNKNKYQEFQDILGKENVQQLEIDLPELQEIDAHKIIRHKLQEALKHHTGPLLIEDTSLYMECLWGKLPWPLIKWFLQEIKNEWLYELAKKYNNFKARATVRIGYAKNADEIAFFEGSVEGTIVEPVYTTDFWRDAIFHPDGYDKPYGAMSKEEKNKISMRRKHSMKWKNFWKKKIYKEQLSYSYTIPHHFITQSNTPCCSI